MHTAVLPSSLSAMGSYTPGPPPIDLHAFHHSSLHLLIAAAGRSVEIAALLKRHFQGIYIDDNDAEPTRLMLASIKGDTAFMKYLLDKDAKPTK